jgi:hypothetical protein
MTILSKFFEDSSFNFRVLDTDQKELYNGSISTDSNGNFISGISFVDDKNGDIETYPYIIQIFDGEKWVNFHIVYPTLVDGYTSRIPLFSASDAEETDLGAGDLIKFNVFPGSIKIILETSVPIDPNIEYSIFMDTDNLSSTGFNINNIGADYKIEYTNNQPILYKYNSDSTWSLINSPYIVGASNGSSIEILMSPEIIQNMSDVIKLVGATYNNDKLIDIIPDTTSEKPYLLFANVDPVKLALSRLDYKHGDVVNITGYGFSPNQIIPISFMKDDGSTLWYGNVQANSNGFIIDEPTLIIPNDFTGTANLYWTGIEMASFAIPKNVDVVSQNYVTFNTELLNLVGLGKQFNIKVDIENLGEDLSNVALKLDTSGKTSDPETVPIGLLKKGDKYSYTWSLTTTSDGFAPINEELISDQENLSSNTIGLHIANFSMNIDAPDNISRGKDFNFNVSIINNQNDIIYTDLKMETSIKNTNINFSRPILSFSPGEIINSSYSINTNDIRPGEYEILTEIISDGTILASSGQNVNVEIPDATPPTTTLTLSGVLGNNSWYVSDVQMNLTAADNVGGSGVNTTEYSFDNITWNTYTTPFNITTEGVTTLYYYSTDNAGNVEPTKNQTIKIDKTPPQITIVFV